MCGRGSGALLRVASSLFCPTWSFHRFDTDTSMVPHLQLELSSTPATYSGLKLRFGSKLFYNSLPRQLLMVNIKQTSSSFRIVGKFIFSGTIRPRRHNIIGMISGVVCWKSISGLEVLSTHNAGVGQVKVHLCVPLNLVLVILQAADRAPPLPLLTSFNHWLQGRVQI